jgi:aminopeptidase N
MPCFDEPCLKAVFKAKVVIKNEKHIAISNTPG